MGRLGYPADFRQRVLTLVDAGHQEVTKRHRVVTKGQPFDGGVMLPSNTLFKMLGVPHVAIAIVLLPSATFFGFFSLLLVTPGLLWLAAIGSWLWRPTRRLRIMLRYPHWMLGSFTILLVAYGVLALQAAQRSAKA